MYWKLKQPDYVVIGLQRKYAIQVSASYFLEVMLSLLRRMSIDGVLYSNVISVSDAHGNFATILQDGASIVALMQGKPNLIEKMEVCTIFCLSNAC